MTTENVQENSARWKLNAEESADGVRTFDLKSWSVFFDFLETEVFLASISSKHTYIWRGQRREDWAVSSSLDRLFLRLGLLTANADMLEKRSRAHLDSFIYAARGRRGSNPRRLDLNKDENEWWALGQHFGLATPLLDWTRSPFAAAYFAFEEIGPDPTDYRVVYGLDQLAVQRRSDALLEGQSYEKGRPPVVEFVDPMSDENQRLVSQSALFTRSPIGTPIEQWVAWAFQGMPTPVLLRIKIPDTDRVTCLRTLNRMNINHLSLFPDLVGASRSTNLRLEIGPQDE